MSKQTTYVCADCGGNRTYKPLGPCGGRIYDPCQHCGAIAIVEVTAVRKPKEKVSHE